MAVQSGWLTMGAALALDACTVAQGPLMVLPGPGKDAEAFRQDYAMCRQPAGASVDAPAAQPGPGGGGQANAGAPGPADPAAWQAAEASFVQCMVGRGNAVQPAPTPYAASAYGAAPYPGAYPYGYAAPAYPYMTYP